jgi:hypothetical protein
MTQVDQSELKAGCARALFTHDTAKALISERALQPAKLFFRAHADLFGGALAVRFTGISQRALKKNPDNYGLYFVDPKAPVPFFWFGLAWSEKDPAGAMPSWGASMEVSGARVAAFDDNVGGLLDACENAAENSEGIKLHRFEAHVELAAWRSFDWLLAQGDQRRALERFWFDYLDALVTWDVPAHVEAFWASQ